MELGKAIHKAAQDVFVKYLLTLLIVSIGCSKVTGQVTLTSSRRAVINQPLTLTCRSPNNTGLIRFKKGNDSQAVCYANSDDCVISVSVSSTRYSVSQITTASGTTSTLNINPVNSNDSGIWSCDYKDSLKSKEINMNDIASQLNWSPVLNNIPSAVRPDERIRVTLTTPCVNKAPIFTWTYQQTPSGSSTNLPGSPSSTTSDGSGCTGSQKKYTNTLNLPGSTTSLYNKEIKLTLTVEHDSFDPSAGYRKYASSNNIQFPVPVTSVTMSEITSNNQQVSRREGETFTLTCVTSPSFPPATVTWSNLPEGASTPTQDRSSGVIVTTSSRVSFPARRGSQNTGIRCQASNIAGQVTQYSLTAKLNIYYPPSKPTITGTTTVCEDTQTYLTCSFSDRGNPAASYSWTKNGNSVQSGVTQQSTTSRWTFTPRKADNGATIICTASSSQYPNIHLDETQLNVYYKPVLMIDSPVTSKDRDQYCGHDLQSSVVTSKKEGDNLELTCRAADSNPDNPAITWTYSSSTVPGPTLSKTNLSRHDTGVYTCQGKINNLCDNKLQSSKLVSVVVNYAPDILSFSPVVIDEGQKLRLTCTAEGCPSEYNFKPFTQYWGDTQVDTKTGVPNGGSYTWAPATATYLDTGDYECKVNNNIRDKNNNLDQIKRTTVLVRSSPKNTSDSSFIVSGAVGSPVNLSQTFYTSGLNVTSYNWTFGSESEVISHSVSLDIAKVTLNKNGVKSKFDGIKVYAIISEFQQADIGIYTVNVCNRLGCGFANINLTAEGPPHVPTNFSIINSTQSEITMRWKPGFPGGTLFTQTFILQYRKVGNGNWMTVQDIEDSDEFVYITIRNLESNTEYEFKVKAKNSRGDEGEFTLLVSQKTKKESSTPSSLTIAGASAGSAVAIIVVVVVVVFVVMRRRRKGGGGTQSNGNLRNDKEKTAATQNPSFVPSDPKEEMIIEECPVYVGAGDLEPKKEVEKKKAGPVEAVYAQVEKLKNKKTKKAGPVEAVYAEVDKPKKKTKKDPEESVYANDVKEKKDGKGKDQGKGKGLGKKGKKKKKDDEKPLKPSSHQGDVYENVSMETSAGNDNSAFTSDEKPKPKMGRDDDGLIYIGVDFLKTDSPSNKIHGQDETTEYADIAFGKVGPPPPPEEEEEEKK